MICHMFAPQINMEPQGAVSLRTNSIQAIPLLSFESGFQRIERLLPLARRKSGVCSSYVVVEVVRQGVLRKCGKLSPLLELLALDHLVWTKRRAGARLSVCQAPQQEKLVCGSNVRRANVHRALRRCRTAAQPSRFRASHSSSAHPEMSYASQPGFTAKAEELRVLEPI